MTDMPEKIWAYLYSGARKKGQLLTSNTPVYGSTEYTRSGIEWNEALEAAAKQLERLLPEYGWVEAADDKERRIDNVRREDVRAIRAMKREPK